MPDWVIQTLAERPEALEQLALWHHEQCLRQGLTASTLPRRRAYLERHLGRQPLPVTLVARYGNGSVVGCVSLVRYRTTHSANARVWLSNLYVDEPHREKGLGRALVERAREYAGKVGLSELWLFTETEEQVNYYRSLGWTRAGNARVGRGAVTIMKSSTAAAR